MARLLARLGIDRSTSFVIAAERDAVTRALRAYLQQEPQPWSFLPTLTATNRPAFRGELDGLRFELRHSAQAGGGRTPGGARVKGILESRGAYTLVRAEVRGRRWVVFPFVLFVGLLLAVAIGSIGRSGGPLALIPLAFAVYAGFILYVLVRSLTTGAVRDLEREFVYATFRHRG